MIITKSKRTYSRIVPGGRLAVVVDEVLTAVFRECQRPAVGEVGHRLTKNLLLLLEENLGKYDKKYENLFPKLPTELANI